VPDPEVFIVGAGPTGLVLALWLTRFGVRVRIVDKSAGPGTTSRALAVQARTLELYDQIGLARAVVERGQRAVAVNLWVMGKKAARAVFEDMGSDVSPFPYALVFPQDEHERLLTSRLAEAGVRVEHESEVLGVEGSGEQVLLRLKRADGTADTCRAAFVAGCDGVHSVVRTALGIGFPGGVYDHLFYVADVEATGAPTDGEVHVGLDRSEFLAVFPVGAAGRARLVGTVQEDAEHQQGSLSWKDVSQRVIQWMHVDVRRVNWFSTYRVHHRVADRFRKGRVFLLGDAAHVHSPVGGQGMNTGIGDAVNLAWKLASVLQGRSRMDLLDTYEPERIAFARRLVSTTDRAFTVVTSPGAIARALRLRVAPLLIPGLFAFAPIRRAMFRTLSQTAVNYRASDLSEGRAGGVRGGDRLPWIRDARAEGEDNFFPLASMSWQVHVYGDVSADLTALCRERGLPVHVFPWRPTMKASGLSRDASYLVRPDGYVALASAAPGAREIAKYLDARQVRPG
jgi:2-polyprenyl-6-methoxyphenol hydroxylase-like FAD-dependent oxidoreductase